MRYLTLLLVFGLGLTMDAEALSPSDEMLGSQSNPGLSCKDILDSNGSTGDGNYWIEPQLGGSAYEVYCLMDSVYDGGGWTLISTHSDDGQDTWTWNNRHYFDTDTTTFGSLSAANEDFKSMALHDVEMQDLLFIHAPSGVWAGYNGVGLSNTSFSTFMLDYQTPSIYSPNSGFPMSSGNLVATNYLNETSLYFSAQEQDGGSGHSYGPTWNATFNSGVNFDDTPNSSLGPCASTTTTSIGPCNEIEWNTYYAGGYTGVMGVGYGFAIGENIGISGNAENYMQVFVR